MFYKLQKSGWSIIKPIQKKNTIRAYNWVVNKFCDQFGDSELTELSSDQILQYLNRITEGRKPQTKRVRFAHLSSFFNFLKNNLDLDFQNPCDVPMMRKLFRSKVSLSWHIIEKETVDEIIFRTTKIRNRLILELMARGGMRIGEVLKLTFNDIQDRKLVIREPKSGKEQEHVFIPQKVANRLREYARQKCKNQNDRIFPISYEAARIMVLKAGNMVGIHLRPHDLRRHAATFASRAGVPIEIISKIILRHANLSTTQLYLGKISDTEAIRWIENLYA
jgi:integrase/recombinase XerD